ncbi:hypothetical protein [uncultured Sphingomonas sp.]|nr:hypothetical protein [uncultured Sphingomonas sp.]
MVDGFSILLTHGLMLFAAWRLLSRPDLDREDGDAPRGFAARRKP